MAEIQTLFEAKSDVVRIDARSREEVTAVVQATPDFRASLDEPPARDAPLERNLDHVLPAVRALPSIRLAALRNAPSVSDSLVAHCADSMDSDS